MPLPRFLALLAAVLLAAALTVFGFMRAELPLGPLALGLLLLAGLARLLTKVDP